MKILFILIFNLLPLSVYAARIDANGSVGAIRYHSATSTLAPSWQKGLWFQLVESNKQFCTDNKVSIAPDNEAAISMILAAKMAGNKIEITIDDTVKYPAGSYCKLQYLTIL
jgi:hypothetical protein